MAGADPGVRIGVDIGGTFTDIVLERGPERITAKVLTTPDAPEEGVRQALAQAMDSCGVAPADVALVIHGTTLATNALIERKGARTALVTTEGFRDSIEMGTESRFEQYDIDMEKPVPLVPRQWRFPIPERLNASGEPILPLDEGAVEATAAWLAAEGIESAAIGLLHSYVNPAHERRVRAILQDALPDLAITLSSEVAPEMREYERFSTACANAYVQPVMARYLRNLEAGLREAGFHCPLFVMLSGGGVADIGTAIRFPIRLVESGPVGGAVFASHVARQCALDRVLSFDMGGTTAKICLIDDAQPRTARAFEVARAHRFLKGSGLPLRIPVIEMVEIGAGGGSIAVVDRLGRITVGPESAGAQPGPACYGQGGTQPTVTDADLAMGRIDPAEFSGGRIALDEQAATDALTAGVGAPLDLEAADSGARGQRDGGREHGERCAGPRHRDRGHARRAHDDRLRRRGPAARGPARREARHGPHPHPDGRGGGLCRRLPPRAGRLRGGAQRLPGGERLQPRADQSRAGGDAVRGRRHRRARSAGRRHAGAPCRLHALSRPGARGRRAAPQPHLGAGGHRHHPRTRSRPPTKRSTGASSRSSTSRS